MKWRLKKQASGDHSHLGDRERGVNRESKWVSEVGVEPDVNRTQGRGSRSRTCQGHPVSKW